MQVSMNLTWLLLLLLQLHCIADASKILEITSRNIAKIIGPKKLTTVLFYSPGCQPCTEVLNVLYKVSSRMTPLHQEFHFGRIDITSQHLLALRYRAEEVPLLKVFAHSSTPISFHGEISEERLLKFLRGLRLQSSVKRNLAEAGERLYGGVSVEQPSGIASTASAASKESASALVAVNGSSYERIVLANHTSVMLALMTSECGDDCQKLERIAEVFQHERHHVVFAVVDVEKEPQFARHFHAQRNPTLLWFPRNNKNAIVRYGGDIDKHEIVGFINDMTGTRRHTDGSLEIGAGRVKELEQLMASRATDLVLGRNIQQLISDARRVVNELPHSAKHTDLYLSIMEQVNKGLSIDKVLEIENKKIMQRLQREQQLAPGERDSQLQLHNIITGITDIMVQLLQQERREAEEAAASEQRLQFEQQQKQKLQQEEELQLKVEKTAAQTVRTREEL